MAEAEVELNTALRNGQADQLNIENVDNDDKVIEMDVALVKVIFYVFTNEILTESVNHVLVKNYNNWINIRNYIF